MTVTGAGLACSPSRAYLGSMGNFLGRFNPFRALLDLRRYLGTRKKYEILFLFGSLMACIVIVGGFAAGSTVQREWQRPTIIYVQSWRADRTDAEIIAQQKIDGEKKRIEDAKQKKEDDERKAAFKRLNDKLSPWL
ncbi:hypothetical protein [Sphingomonas sp.]|uniref:hypothetical protein n=1 Tax=Sphingomonas sp. TaxID=28214 RepID=UPI0025E65411|nr:hypothetical protein [Sphingomonas sp.]